MSFVSFVQSLDSANKSVINFMDCQVTAKCACSRVLSEIKTVNQSMN